MGVGISETMRAPLLAERRQEQLLAYLARHRSAQVSELSGVFGVSMSTVRRDLQEMEERDLVRRVHGGALLITDRAALKEPAIVLRTLEHADQKRRIGHAAADLVHDGATIIVTGGTTTEAMVPHLAARTGLTVVTNALNIAQGLTAHRHVDVVVLGGWLRHAESTLLGHLTTQALADLHADQIFYGTFGLDVANGLTGTSIREVQTDRALIAAARELIVLADHSKFAQSGPSRVVPLDAVARVVTDTGAPVSAIEALRAREIAVVQA